jgi:hypothetical protein
MDATDSSVLHSLELLAIVRWSEGFVSINVLTIIPVASGLVLKVFAIDIVLGRQRRHWDARSGVALSRILERIESGTVEKRTLGQDEAINLHHPSVISLSSDPEPRSSTYNISPPGFGTQSIILGTKCT